MHKNDNCVKGTILMDILTTGVRSGLGRYIHENLGGIGYTRQISKKELQEIENRGVDIIIHCAFNSSHGITYDSLNDYVEDNVFLTKKLASIPHSMFIFISSVDIYPKNDLLHSEDEVIEADSVSGIYGITKLMSEAIVKNCCRNYLILRGSAFLGKYSRKNSLIRIIEEECTLTLAGDSVFNYVLHSDILDLIKYMIDNRLTGMYNLVSSENITLSEVANMLGKKVVFGNYRYDVGKIDNRKISAIFPVFNKTSKEVVVQFSGEKT
jgi:nucleoside-diphosphate-sugar epimerase